MIVRLISEDQFHDLILGTSLLYEAKTDTYEAAIPFFGERVNLWGLYDEISSVPKVNVEYFTVDVEEEEIRFYIYEEWQG